MTDREPNQQPEPEEVPGAEAPGTDDGEPTAEFVVAEGPDVETSFSEADEAFLKDVSAGSVAPEAETEHLADLRRVTAEYANYRRRAASRRSRSPSTSTRTASCTSPPATRAPARSSR